MTGRLDQLLAQLVSATPDRPLDQLEPAVWGRVDGERFGRRDGEWGWRAALTAVMLATGAFAGSVAAAQSGEESPFAIHAALAPSTLLETHP